MARILVADDEESIRLVLATALTQAGHAVEVASTGSEALARLIDRTFDVAILDIRMPDLSGLDVLARVREAGAPVVVIVITAQNTMANAIEAMKRGAFNYLTKPFDLDEVRALVARASEMRRLRDTVGRIRTELVGRYEPGVTLIGTSPAMQDIFKTIGRLASSDATILIEGESGTGKELIARAIHAHSPRWSGPFIALNCAALPRDLLESELFGHERGAFTGANERRIGRFEAAGGGTLFLDEIGDMPLDLQVKLLRVLQEREFSRVGSTTTIATDARMIAATNQILERAVRDGRFREDLYFRLKVVPIVVPPLRERRGDIPQLIRHFLAKANAEMGTDINSITPEAEALLVRHPWPGNVRELENMLVRAAVLAPGETLTEADLQLPEAAPPPALAGSLAETLHSAVAALVNDPNRPGKDLHAAVVAAVERPLLEFVLAQTGGNQLRAADLLGINRNTLRKKLTVLGIPIPRGAA
ncbi:MAG: nitrogen regulation protein NR(I) [Polyangiaceae bacterium UTPRO1]|jgi:two-component system nitrogen regulation response regulator GlnG|nr:nitrogen regulation protein NR(I) [Myxococcales bacterium]OQY65420.1 MAG: nitrogen regulation protein NR(I) [Polyangiaceae bacterium UTPRO1]